MGVAAVLVMLPRSRKQTFAIPAQKDFTLNLASIGPVVSDEQMFENVDVGRTTDDGCHAIQ